MENQEIANGRVRGRAWVGVTRGAHRLVAADDPWLADLAAWQSVLPASATFTGLTAARTRGWWLPPLPEDLPVFVAVVTGGGHPDRAGLVLSRHPVQPAYDLLDGLRVATPAEALMACARVLGLLDLVVLVDAALHGGDCSAADLREAAAQRRRGARLLRRALELADGRSESVLSTRTLTN
jgi:hypothetical protein